MRRLVSTEHRPVLQAQNALPKITDKSYLRGGSGITALEAYHAGAIRALLLQNADTIIQPWGVSVATVTAVRAPSRDKRNPNPKQP